MKVRFEMVEIEATLSAGVRPTRGYTRATAIVDGRATRTLTCAVCGASLDPDADAAALRKHERGHARPRVRR